MQIVSLSFYIERLDRRCRVVDVASLTLNVNISLFLNHSLVAIYGNFALLVEHFVSFSHCLLVINPIRNETQTQNI